MLCTTCGDAQDVEGAMPAMEVARALGLVVADDGGDRSVKTSPGGAVKGVGGAWGSVEGSTVLGAEEGRGAV